MSNDHLLSAAVEAGMDVATLNEAGTTMFANWVRSLDVGAADKVLADLEKAPNFVGSALFDTLVAGMSAARRRRLWDTGAAPVAMAARHAATETERPVRQVLALRYGLDLPDSEDLMMEPLEWTSKGMWRRVNDIIASGHADRLPLRVRLRWAQKAPKRATADEREHMERFIAANHPQLALTILASDESTQYARLLACSNPVVTSAHVLEVLADLQAAEPDGNLEAGLRALLTNRPVMTSSEVVAAQDVAIGARIDFALKVDIDQRIGWELSDAEFAVRVNAARSAAELVGLVGLVPPFRWGSHRCALTALVMGSPHATAEVAEQIIHAAGRADGVLEHWTPTNDVWDHGLLLSHALEAFGPVAGKSHNKEWAKVLGGQQARDFTAAAIANPDAVPPYLWASNMPWDGDLEALALQVPAWATASCAPPLKAAVLNAVATADLSTALPLLNSFRVDGSNTTVGDVLGAHAAALA